MAQSLPPIKGNKGFTLVELLVSMAVLVVLLLILLSITDQVSKIWRQTTGRIETFREARTGFESMTRQISQATLNTYWDYFDAAGNPRTNANAATFVPAQYRRQSELRFQSGFATDPGGLIPTTNSNTTQPTTPIRPTHAAFFQAPLGYVETATYSGLENLLNTWGYYVEYTSDKGLKPSFINPGTAKNRFRLMQMMEPSESLTLYSLTSGNSGLKSSDPNGMTWFRTPLTSTAPVRTRVMAENVVALVILPKLAKQDEDQRVTSGKTNILLSPLFSYDSTNTSNYIPAVSDSALNPKNQLPPVVQVTMVALDETSATRLSQISLSQGKTPDQVLGLDAARNPRLFSVANTGVPNNYLQYQADLTTLGTTLVANHLAYRVFTTNVPIRGAKWSTEQTQ